MRTANIYQRPNKLTGEPVRTMDFDYNGWSVSVRKHGNEELVQVLMTKGNESTSRLMPMSEVQNYVQTEAK